MDEKKHRGNVE